MLDHNTGIALRLTHVEIVLYWTVKHLNKLHDVRMIEFLLELRLHYRLAQADAVRLTMLDSLL